MAAVVLAPHDPSWSGQLAQEMARLQAHLPLVRLEPIGSTAVPGLCAKPILDLMAGLPAPEGFGPALERLQSLGYEHLGEHEPGRHFLRQPEAPIRHLHLVRLGEEPWRRHLAFRDRLREDPNLRDAYASLKHQLAAAFPEDRAAYTEGKTAFIRAAEGPDRK